VIDVTEGGFVVIDKVPGISLHQLEELGDAALRPETGVAGRGGLR
jgi:hypothetical protein